MKDKILTLNLKDNYRIIAISDVHAHLDLFESLLDLVALKADDHLIIIGDFINKGPDSLPTLHKMMALKEQRPNTYILKGNHEFFICKHMFQDGHNQKFLNYLKDQPFQNIVEETTIHGGFDLHKCEQMSDLVAWSMTHYKAEYEFMHHLPVLAYADDLIFVHGGYHKDMDVAQHEAQLLKYDDFNHLSEVNDRTVIVGHWPTANLRQNRNSNTPFFNDEKHIITIDGGIGVKSSGELNALIIEKKAGKQKISYQQSNTFKTITIKRTHDFTLEDKCFINYPYFAVELIQQGPTMTLCRHIHSGKELSIFNCLLKEVDGKTQVITTYINHFLNLKVGEEVSLVRAYKDCALVKHKDEFGWVLTQQI